MGANEKSAATWNGSSEAEAGRQAMSNNHDLFPYDGHLERHADEQAEGNDRGAFPYVTADAAAQSAWLIYRDQRSSQLYLSARRAGSQMRRREFIAGYLAALSDQK